MINLLQDGDQVRRFGVVTVHKGGQTGGLVDDQDLLVAPQDQIGKIVLVWQRLAPLSYQAAEAGVSAVASPRRTPIIIKKAIAMNTGAIIIVAL